MAQTIVDVEIEGTAPLIQHNIEGAEAQMLRTVGRKRTPRGVQDEPEEYRRYFYHFPGNGHLGHPGAAIESALVQAARDFKADKRRTMKDTIKACVYVNEELVELIGKKKEDRVLRASVVNPNTRGRGFRYRPLFDTGWRAKFSLTLVDTELCTLELLNDILADAGRRIGIGNWRPKFGRFVITKFQARK